MFLLAMPCTNILPTSLQRPRYEESIESSYQLVCYCSGSDRPLGDIPSFVMRWDERLLSEPRGHQGPWPSMNNNHSGRSDLRETVDPDTQIQKAMTEDSEPRIARIRENLKLAHMSPGEKTSYR
ncbi:unnamed protein product [Onchocerca flexuosa]|uniref:Uncharacterized protein n=1 Tax=Onchocerca flexuosa TaxID=387005 RepID=A0A183HZ52_9BILA|nr:unnamed protein product [Onchocerca flexuosa]